MLNKVAVEATSTIIDFPLRGEWTAFTTPAERVPSHGTDWGGQRFAYDFVAVKRTPDFAGTQRVARGLRFCGASNLRCYVLGAASRDCYGWGEPIHAPFDGTVITVRDGWPDRRGFHVLLSIALLLRGLILGPLFLLHLRLSKTDDFRLVAGNYLIVKMRGQEIYAFFAHARRGSIRVSEGQEVSSGQHLADVGHSGNSTGPHLHFQLMDSAKLPLARGMPCSFSRYEAFRQGRWEIVEEGVPCWLEVIRYGA